MTFTPSPSLAHATCQVLAEFARHRPRVGAFRLFLENGDDAQHIVATWARAILGISLEALPEAAQRWTAQRDAIPTPAAFAAFARQIDNAEFRRRGRLDLLPEAARPGVVERRSVRVREVERARLSVRETGTLWDALLAAAATEEARQAVREGEVSDDAFNAALHQVLAQRNTPAGIAP